MINSIMNNIRVAKVNCFNEERLGAGKGFLVWLVANNGYDFGTYRDNDYEEDFPRKEVMFIDNTIDEALHQASDFLLGLELQEVTRNIKESGIIIGESLKSLKV